MKLFVLGLRRSGTTILYDALGEDADLRHFYEPLREETVTVGGGSGARDEDAFAETRAVRERFRTERYPELEPEEFNWGGPRAPELELNPELPDHVRALLAHLLDQGAAVAIKETRLHHKLGALAAIAPDAAVVHLVRDPRAVCASMLLGRRRRTDLYPDADTFFSARTERKLWSSRRISEKLLRQPGAAALPEDIPDFLRPLLVWKAAIEATHDAGVRHYDNRYALVRLDDVRSEPQAALERIYGLLEREPPAPVVRWAAANISRDVSVHLGSDPRWAKAARLLGLERALELSGYGEILALDSDPTTPLDVTPPRHSRLSGLIGRARRRAGP